MTLTYKKFIFLDLSNLKSFAFPKRGKTEKKKTCDKCIFECVILLFLDQFPFSFSKYFEEKQLVLND